MKSLLATLVLVAAASPAFGSSLTCSSSDQRLSYREFISSGGALMQTETVAFDGATVFQRLNFNVEIQTATLARGAKKVLAGPVVGRDGSTRTTFAQSMTLVDAAGATLFKGFALCDEVIAPVCQLCP